MIVEYIRYAVDPGRVDGLVDAYRRGGVVLDADPHCLAWELSVGVEEPGHVTVRIEWDSVEGHEQGFRRSAPFGEFLAAVRPFFADIQEMKHYQPRGASDA